MAARKATPDAREIRRAALAEQILLDALRASWAMPVSSAESVFRNPEGMAKFAVETATALVNQLEATK